MSVNNEISQPPSPVWKGQRSDWIMILTLPVKNIKEGDFTLQLYSRPYFYEGN